MRVRTELTTDQIAALGALVDGRISTNDSVLDLHGRDESAFPQVKPSAVITVHTNEKVLDLIIRKYLDKSNSRDVNYFTFCADVDRPEDMFPALAATSSESDKKPLSATAAKSANYFFACNRFSTSVGSLAMLTAC